MARIADRKENQPVFASVCCQVHGLEHIFLIRNRLTGMILPRGKACFEMRCLRIGWGA